MFSLTNPCVSVVISSSPRIFPRPPNRSLHCSFNPTQSSIFRSSVTKIKAARDEKEQTVTVSVTVEEEDEVQSTPNKVRNSFLSEVFTKTKGMHVIIIEVNAIFCYELADKNERRHHIAEVEECVKLLKEAAKTRKVPATEILTAFKVLEKAKLDPSRFCETLGGSQSPGRTWMLIFTSQKGLKSGKYFPITAVQRFDAAARRIENGVYLGGLGCLTFEGRFSWQKRILAFVFELIRIKIGPFNPFEINIKGGGDDESEPNTKNPFFIWFYIDEEIAVARGRSGGTAFWCRCKRVV